MNDFAHFLAADFERKLLAEPLIIHAHKKKLTGTIRLSSSPLQTGTGFFYIYIRGHINKGWTDQTCISNYANAQRVAV